jgi:inorganic pyrophosphatase
MIRAIVEMPKLTTYKYEIDKISNKLVLDRVIDRAVPFNYGFIPKTLSKDGDPLDVFIISGDPIVPLSEVKLELLGVIVCVDNGKEDEKIIAKIANDKYPIDMDDYNKIIFYLENYKPHGQIILKEPHITKCDASLASEYLIKATKRAELNIIVSDFARQFGRVSRIDEETYLQIAEKYEGINDLFTMWKKETLYRERDELVNDIVEMCQEILSHGEV